MTEEKLTDEIKNHLATFPERHQDVLEMKREWDEYKGKALWVLIGFLASILAIGVWVGTITSTLDKVNDDHAKVDERYNQVERRLGTLEVTNGEIKARLASIEAVLQEIKLSIRELR
jgi:flagellar basal body-associated protein FliL